MVLNLDLEEHLPYKILLPPKITVSLHTVKPALNTTCI